jgi:hypothetical protein
MIDLFLTTWQFCALVLPVVSFMLKFFIRFRIST